MPFFADRLPWPSRRALGHAVLGHDAEDLERLGLAGVAHGVAVAHGAVVGLAGLGVLALAVVVNQARPEIT